MTTYTAYFHTDAEWASCHFEADTPEHALALARQFYDEEPSSLSFESYDKGMEVNEIKIIDPDGNTRTWFDENLTLRLAAGDMLEALEFIAADIEQGIRGKGAWLKLARAAIAKAKGGAA